MTDTEIAGIAAIFTPGMTDVFPSANAGGTTDAKFTLADISGMKRRTFLSVDTVVQNHHMKVSQ
jgi:hypothetical protein